MRLIEAVKVLEDIKYRDGYQLKWKHLVGWDPAIGGTEDYYLRIWWHFERPDFRTGELDWSQSGDVIVNLSRSSEESLIRTVFGMTLRLEEHECREFFSYGGTRVFNPHRSLLEEGGS